MNTWRIALVLMVTFALVSGCAKPDWIQDTLVTVDVTGTWVRIEGPWLQLKLEQRGSHVTGSMEARTSYGGAVEFSGTLEGSVAGDVFRFAMTRRSTLGTGVPSEGKMTVSGDEMTGTAGALRRVSSSPRPPQQ